MPRLRWTLFWTERDLWPDRLRGRLICGPLGHRFTVWKMTDLLCDRCSIATPRPAELTYTSDGQSYCAECNANTNRKHPHGCRLRYAQQAR
jgi:hypothetical protein